MIRVLRHLALCQLALGFYVFSTVLLPLLATKIAAGQPCVDEDPLCEHWSNIAECVANPYFMRKACAKSCQAEPVCALRPQWPIDWPGYATEAGTRLYALQVHKLLTAEHLLTNVAPYTELLYCWCQTLMLAMLRTCAKQPACCSCWSCCDSYSPYRGVLPAWSTFNSHTRLLNMPPAGAHFVTRSDVKAISGRSPCIANNSGPWPSAICT